VVAQSFTIPATVTDSPTFQVENDFFVNGETQSVTINGIFGTLTKVNNNYIFKRKAVGLETVITIGTNIFFVIDPAESENKNPLKIGSAALEEQNGELISSLPFDVQNGGQLFAIPTSSGYLCAFVEETTNEIYFGVKIDRSLVFNKGAELGDVANLLIDSNPSSGYLIDLRDAFNQIMFAIKNNGQTVIESLAIGDVSMFRSLDSRYIWHVLDEIYKNIAFAIKKNGVVEINSLDVRRIESTSSPDIFHFFGTSGQSNSVGADGVPYVEQIQPFNNLMVLDTTSNIPTVPGYTTLGDNLVFTALVTPLKTSYGAGAYPLNIAGQDHTTAFANSMAWKLGAANQWIASSYGQAGTGIDVLKKGGSGNAWASGNFELEAAVMIAARQNMKVVMEAEILILGENDNANADYERQLIEWGYLLQERKKITGQSRDIPLLSFQQHTFAPAGNVPALSTTAELYANNKSPHHYLVGPRYQYHYVPVGGGPTGVHHDSWSHMRIGAKAAQVLEIINVKGGGWEPLKPKKISYTQSTGIIAVQCHVPSGPLRFDKNITQPTQIQGGGANPWSAAKGFEVDGVTLNTGNPVTISGNSIFIQVPANTAITRLRYAMSSNQTGGYVYGDRSGNGRRGAVCDSDPYRGYYAETILCNVTNNSFNVTSVAPKGFARRGWYDRVSGGQPATGVLAPFSIIANRVSDNQITLSDGWYAPTGQEYLTFWYDHSNYLVAFDLPINYQE
jgi:hypothetical protein